MNMDTRAIMYVMQHKGDMLMFVVLEYYDQQHD